ncbi:MAG TPA: hypothetical protein VF221_02435, partial [Chloroflexota bacterium]
ALRLLELRHHDHSRMHMLCVLLSRYARYRLASRESRPSSTRNQKSNVMGGENGYHSPTDAHPIIK